MLSGENVVIQRKQKDSFDVAWRSHLSAAGNTFWGSRSNNNQGQLDRRVLLFDFVETIEEKDRNNNVINEIKDNMLPIIIKGIRAYKSLIAAAKHHTSTVRLPPCICPPACPGVQSSSPPQQHKVNSTITGLTTKAAAAATPVKTRRSIL